MFNGRNFSNPHPRDDCTGFNQSQSWWRHQMETFSALLAICAGNSPVSGEFPTQRPVTRSFDVYFDLRPDKRLSKQSLGWWFETLSHSLWRHRNGNRLFSRLIAAQITLDVLRSSTRNTCLTAQPLERDTSSVCELKMYSLLNAVRSRQNSRHFPNDIFKCIFLNENVWISIKVSPKFVPKGPINNIPALVQILVWRR